MLDSKSDESRRGVKMIIVVHETAQSQVIELPLPEDLTCGLVILYDSRCCRRVTVASSKVGVALAVGCPCVKGAGSSLVALI